MSAHCAPGIVLSTSRTLACLLPTTTPWHKFYSYFPFGDEESRARGGFPLASDEAGIQTQEVRHQTQCSQLFCCTEEPNCFCTRVWKCTSGAITKMVNSMYSHCSSGVIYGSQLCRANPWSVKAHHLRICSRVSVFNCKQ